MTENARVCGPLQLADRRSFIYDDEPVERPSNARGRPSRIVIHAERSAGGDEWGYATRIRRVDELSKSGRDSVGTQWRRGVRRRSRCLRCYAAHV
jgi:hypothetical protein